MQRLQGLNHRQESGCSHPGRPVTVCLLSAPRQTNELQTNECSVHLAPDKVRWTVKHYRCVDGAGPSSSQLRIAVSMAAGDSTPNTACSVSRPVGSVATSALSLR